MTKIRIKNRKKFSQIFGEGRKRGLNWPGLLFLLFILIMVGLGLVLLFNKLAEAITHYLIYQLAINDFYIDKLVGFSLLFITAPLFLILLVLDGEQRKISRRVGKYITKLVVKDYYKQSHINIEGQQVARKSSPSDVSQREVSSVRPEPDAIEQQYIQGELNGTFKEFFSNGNVKREITYLNGKKNGLMRTYYENGQLEQEGVYIDDQFEGTYRSYYEDGTLHQEKDYLKGQLNGIYKACDEHGIPFFEISYKNNMQHGPDKIYDKMGSLQYIDEYKDGILVNRKTYDEYGNLKFDQDFKDNVTIAKWIEAEEKIAQREAQERANRWRKRNQ